MPSQSVCRSGLPSTFEVSDAYQYIFVPLQIQQVLAFGATGGPGHHYSYVFCHGTDLPTATAIFREMVIRPTVPGTGLGANCDADFPPTCLYSQAAVGEMDLGTVRQAVERELKISKGLQGIVVVGEFRSVKAHLNIAWADTLEEARLCFCGGAVRNKDRWAFNSAYAQIRGFVVPLPM